MAANVQQTSSNRNAGRLLDRVNTPLVSSWDCGSGIVQNDSSRCGKLFFSSENSVSKIQNLGL